MASLTGMTDVIQDNATELIYLFNRIANILEKAGAKDPIDQMVLNYGPRAGTRLPTNFLLTWER